MCNALSRGTTCQLVTPPCVDGLVLQCDGVACGGECGGTCCRCVPPGQATALSSSSSSSLPAQPSMVCSDTDGGDNPAVLGATTLNGFVVSEEKCTVYQNLGGGFGWHSVTECAPQADPQPGIPYCTAVETYCSGSAVSPVQFRNNPCEFGCRNGLCLTEWPSSQSSSSASSFSVASRPPAACVDTDGGDNPLVKSFYGLVGGSTNEEYCITYEPDSANPSQYSERRVESCGSTNFCYVKEFACGRPSGLRNVPCRNGCVNGACFAPPKPGAGGAVGTTGTTGTKSAASSVASVGTPACTSDLACGNRECGACDNVGSECKHICLVPTCANGACVQPRYEWEACDPSACQ